jgi:hypothetical protein
MRTVQIIHDPGNQRTWVAVDCQTGKQLLRFHDHELLVKTCNGLGWYLRQTAKQKNKEPA